MLLSKVVNGTSLIKTLSAFALLMTYSIWAFTIDTSWTDAMKAAGRLPETAPGFHQDLPNSAFSKLGAATSSYQKFQFIDIPYALLNTIFALTAIGLGLKIFNLTSSVGRFLLYLPFIYLGAEAIENTLLLMMTSGLLDASGLAATAQQGATTLKMASITPALILSVLSVVIVSITFIVRRLKRHK